MFLNNWGNGLLVENTEDDIGYKLDKIFDDYENYRNRQSYLGNLLSRELAGMRVF